MTIIFVGTSSFSIPTLHILQKHHQIAAVITRPDAPCGRGKKLSPSPVKEAARTYGLTVHDAPVDVLSDTIRALNPDLIVVTSYGALIPADILATPRSGALNLHPSLLPRYRGASPIQAAILNGDEETGVTIIRMIEALDAGPIIAQKKIALPGGITAGALHDTLAQTGAELLRETLEKKRLFKGIQQDESRASYTKKITPADAELDPRESAVVLERKVRAYNPTPGAYIKSQKSKVKSQNFGRIKIFSAYIKKDVPQQMKDVPFIILDQLPALVCADGNALVLTDVQPEDRNRMRGEEFANGYLLQRP